MLPEMRRAIHAALTPHRHAGRLYRIEDTENTVQVVTRVPGLPGKRSVFCDGVGRGGRIVAHLSDGRGVELTAQGFEWKP